MSLHSRPRYSTSGSVNRPRKIRLRITSQATQTRGRQTTSDEEDREGLPSVETSPLSPLPDEYFNTLSAASEATCIADTILCRPSPVANLNITAKHASLEDDLLPNRAQLQEDKENRDDPLARLSQRPHHHPSTRELPETPSKPNLTKPLVPKRRNRTGLEKEISRLFDFGNIGTDRAGRDERGKSLRGTNVEQGRERKRLKRGERSGVQSSGRGFVRVLSTGRRIEDKQDTSTKTFWSTEKTRLSPEDVENDDQVYIHTGKDPKLSIGLEDVEAALTMQYLARDAELGRRGYPATKVEMPMGVRDEKTVTLVSSGETECFLLKQGLSLARGECSNCRVDETQAKFWWTDPVVKSELGLDRRLCHACGIYKYHNLVDRPNIFKETKSYTAPIQSQPLPLTFPQTPLRSTKPPCPDTTITESKTPPGSSIGDILGQSDWVYIFPPASYGLSIKPYSAYKMVGEHDCSRWAQSGDVWNPDVQHISWRSP